MRFIPPGSSYSNISLPSGPAQCGLPDGGLAMNHPSGELRQAVLWCTPWLPQHFTCVVGLLLFRLIRTIHGLQIGGWHPSPFVLQLAKPPACKESSRGQEQRVSQGHRGSVPSWGRHKQPRGLDGRDGAGACLCLHGATSELGRFILFPPGQETSQAEASGELARFFLGLPHNLLGQNQLSCGSM